MQRTTKAAVLASAVLVLVLSVTGLAGAIPVATPSGQGSAPGLVNYQGRVTVAGVPYEGVGHFKFALVSGTGDTTYWSNDGTSAGGGEPENAVQLPVEQGIFSVMLGDTSLPNMTVLSADVFSDGDRHFRVWFSSDASAFSRLLPDQQVTSVPYAFRAEHATDADTLQGRDPSSFADAGDVEGGSLPSGTMLLGNTRDDASLISLGFQYTGRVVGDESRPRAAMPTSRRWLTAEIVEGVVYAIGGMRSGHGSSANEAYDPMTDSWTARASMPTTRWDLDAAALDGTIYAIGGDQYPVVLTANEAYDPATDSWTTKAPMPTGRRDLAVVAVDGLVYAIGGLDGSTWDDGGSPLSVVEAYDPQTDSWADRAPRPTAGAVLATVVDGTIYAFGPGSAVDAYDPATDTWTTKSPIPDIGWIITVEALDDLVYVLAAQRTATYNPRTDSWETWTAHAEHRFWHGSAPVFGVICVFGGATESPAGPSYSVECYTPPMYVYRRE